MARSGKTSEDQLILQAALEGFELQRQRIDEQISQLRSKLGKRVAVTSPASAVEPTVRKKLSSAARKRIAAAQTKRWAAFRKDNAAAKSKT